MDSRKLNISLVGLLILSWFVGIFIANQTSSQNELSVPISLSAANVQQIGSQAFFELNIKPEHQQRWVKSLGLTLIESPEIISVPDFSLFSDWNSRNSYVRAPYSNDEVSEWWRQHLHTVPYGYIHRLPSGGYLVLDLKRDCLTGWAEQTELDMLMP